MKGIRKTIRRRRLEAKTDYLARLEVLKSGLPRVVVRKTNKYMIVQIVSSEIAQDKVVAGAKSKDLLAHGWPENAAGSLKSLAACYLTGILVAKQAAKHGIKRAVFDIGMQRTANGGRLYAVLKGIAEGGLDVPHSEKVLPTDERIEQNTKTRALIQKVKEKIK